MANPGFIFTPQDQYSLSSGSDPIDGYPHVMGEDIAGALTANGWPCQACAAWKITAEIFAQKPPFVLGMNLIPDWSVTASEGKEPIPFYQALRKYLKVTVVNILLDQAFHHFDVIAKHSPALDGIVMASLEHSDASFLERIGVPSSRMVHLPWGGPPTEPNPKPFKDRAYDLIFHGGMDPVESNAAYRASLAKRKYPDATIDAMVRATDMVIEEGEGVAAAVEAAGKVEGLDLTQLNLAQAGLILWDVDMRARRIRRRKFLLAFADMPVHFFGKYPPEFAHQFSRASFHGGKTFREIVGIMGDAKISLCETINWRDNAHLRLTYAIPHGCLVAAEKNARLGLDFTDMEDIVFSSHPYGDMAEKARTVLANPRRGQEMADAARSVYESRYTWRETVKALAPFLPPPAKMARA